jgi:hypothetical protein
MTRTKLIRVRIKGKRVSFTRGTPGIVDASMVEDWKCPKCYKPTDKAKCLISHTQLGFDWDSHIDYFKCKCGTFYYCNYLVWLVQRSAS